MLSLFHVVPLVDKARVLVDWLVGWCIVSRKGLSSGTCLDHHRVHPELPARDKRHALAALGG